MFCIKHCFRWEKFLHVGSLFCTTTNYTGWWVMMMIMMMMTLKSSTDEDDDYLSPPRSVRGLRGWWSPVIFWHRGRTGGSLLSLQCHSVTVVKCHSGKSVTVLCKLKPQINCCLYHQQLSSFYWTFIWFKSRDLVILQLILIAYHLLDGLRYYQNRDVSITCFVRFQSTATSISVLILKEKLEGLR